MKLYTKQNKGNEIKQMSTHKNGRKLSTETKLQHELMTELSHDTSASCSWRTSGNEAL